MGVKKITFKSTISTPKCRKLPWFEQSLFAKI